MIVTLIFYHKKDKRKPYFQRLMLSGLNQHRAQRNPPTSGRMPDAAAECDAYSASIVSGLPIEGPTTAIETPHSTGTSPGRPDTNKNCRVPDRTTFPCPSVVDQQCPGCDQSHEILRSVNRRCAYCRSAVIDRRYQAGIRRRRATRVRCTCRLQLN